MWTPLKVKYSHLKKRSKERTVERRRMKDQIRYLCEVIERLRLQNALLEERSSPQQVFNHHYPAQMIALAVFMVLHGGSLRCASATVLFYADLMGWTGFKQPSASTVRNWVCRCGLHALRYTKDLKGEYVAILDESIQIGKEKLLLMLGVPVQKGQSYCQPLSHQDVVVLGMEVRTSWTGTLIAKFIKARLLQCKQLNLLYLISDQGTSIKAAVKVLKMDWVSDCTHVMMNAVKSLFEHDEALSQFCAQVGQLRRRLILTDFTILLPPTLRDKDRFLRVFTLVQWADRMDKWWVRLCPKAKRHLQFYRDNPTLLYKLRQVRHLMVITSSILKNAGLGQSSYQRWQTKIAEFKTSAQHVGNQATSFIKIIDDYFQVHARLYEKHHQLLCCSDIIESTFGKYKNKKGMKVISADVLSIALYSRHITTDFAKQAMEIIACKDVEEWQHKYVCPNRFGLMYKMKQELKNAG